jgi:hypothetical protein
VSSPMESFELMMGIALIVFIFLACGGPSPPHEEAATITAIAQGVYDRHCPGPNRDTDTRNHRHTASCSDSDFYSYTDLYAETCPI